MPFPTYKPTQRNYTEGTYPVKVFTSIGGVEYRRIYGAAPSGYKLELSYTLPDSQANDFLTHYDQCRGTYIAFLLAASHPVWNGTGLATTLSSTPQDTAITWRYESPPQITPLPGSIQYSTVNISLLGVLQTNFNRVGS